jgi:hypothetical protein
MGRKPQFDRWLAARGTRRAFLGGAARLGAGAAALIALDTSWLRPSAARASRPEHPQVLIEDTVERSRADWTRGQAGVGANVGASGVVLPAGGGEFVSGAVGLPIAATHLGLHWVAQGGSPEALAVLVRTGGAGGGWSEWQELTVEATSGNAVFAALVPGRKSRLAQYRVTNTSEETVELSQMTLTSINTDDGPLLTTSASAGEPVEFSYPVADGTTITIVSRRGWGCDESLRFSGGSERWPEMYVPTKKVVLHHTATSNNYVDGAAEVRAIYAYHAQTQGWGDIGYQILVDRHGNIYEGRHGRGEDAQREIASADVVAGHVFGFNYGTTGVAAIGHSSQGSWRNNWGAVGMRALEDAVTFECGRHFIDPQGESPFLKAHGDWSHTLSHCPGHGDCVSTQCPGSTLINHLPNLRSNVAARLNGEVPPALSGGLTDPNTLAFSWPSGAYRYCLEGWIRKPNSEDIEYLSGFNHAAATWSDAGAYEQVWTATSGAGVTFPSLANGHYTMHLRRDSTGVAGRYESNRSFWLTGGGSEPPPVANPPVVTLTQPLAGSTVSGVITIAAEATDDNGVSKVEFFVNGASIGLGSSSGNVWSRSWDTATVSDGARTLRATATDTAGQSASHEISVTVSNGEPSAGGMHIGDLDGESVNNGSTWTARVTITVHDPAHAPLAGALVDGVWGGGASGAASGVTGADGTCVVQVAGIPKRTGSVSLTVNNVSYTGLTYDAIANHDPDGDSNGTSIVVSK